MGILRSMLYLTFATAAACGGDGGTGPNPPVNPPAPTLATIRVPSQNLNLTAGQTATLAPQALDGAGAVIPNVVGFTFSSTDESIAELRAGGTVLAVGAGNATVRVSLTRDGVTATTDVSVTVTGTLAVSATVTAGASSTTFTPPLLLVAVAANVDFAFGALTHNVTFGSVTGAPTNVPNTSSATVTRAFPTAGDFPYECTLHPGMAGTVLVR